MFHMPENIAIDHLKDVPGFKGLLKAVIKSQIQLLLEQLAKYTDEESLILSASVADGGFSHMASETAKSFLSDKEELKSQFLRHCLKVHHKHQNPVQEKDHSFPEFGQDIPHASFLQRMKNAMNEESGDYHTPMPEERPSIDHHFKNNKAVFTNENRRRKRLKAAKPYNYFPLSNLDTPNSYGITNTIPDEHKEIFMTQEPNKTKYLESSVEESIPMKLKTVPVKVEIDLEEADEEESVTVDKVSDRGEDMGNSFDSFKQFNEPVLDMSSFKHFSDPALDMSGNMDNEPTVVDLSIAATTSSNSGNGESQNLYASQFFNQVLPISEDTQELSQNQIANLYNCLETGKTPKKRVYRKVECDICHKMIYITNIKVHKFRHLQQMEKMKVTQSLLPVSTILNAR